MSQLPQVESELQYSPEQWAARTAGLRQFIAEQMVQGEDYGSIGSSRELLLLKAGAEKLNAIFGLAPLVTITHRAEDWEADFASYEVKVSLVKKATGAVEAEGIGSCNSRERKYKNQGGANTANTLLKMAKKRALVDATLNVTAISGMFVAEVEDVPDRPSPRGQQSRPAPQFHGRVPATDAQLNCIESISTPDERAQFIGERPVSDLTKAEASQLIDNLKAQKTRV